MFSPDVLIKEGYGPILTLWPQWEEGMRWSFNTNTIISESINGREDRHRKYHRPLMNLSFTGLILSDRESVYFRNFFVARGDRTVGVPVWPDACYIDGIEEREYLPGKVGQCLKCEARNRVFPWCRFAIIYRNAFDFVITSITECGDGIVWLHNKNLSAYNGENWRGCYLVPLAFGEVKFPDFDFKNSKVSVVSVDFKEKFGQELGSKVGLLTVGDFNRTDSEHSLSEDTVYYPIDCGDGFLENYQEFPVLPDWNSEPKQGGVDDLLFDALDGGANLPSEVFTFDRRTLSFSYRINRWELQKILYFFNAKQGSLHDFNVPTFTADYKVLQAEDIESSDGETVLSNGYLVLKPSGLGFMDLKRFNGFYKYVNGEWVRSEFDEAWKIEDCRDVIRLPSPSPGGPDNPKPGDDLSASVKVRFRDDKIEIDVYNPDVFDCACDFIEVKPDENINLAYGSANDTVTSEIYLYLFNVFNIDESYFTSCWAGYGYGIETNLNEVPGFEGRDSDEKIVWRGADVEFGSLEYGADMLGEELKLKCKGVLMGYLSECVESNKRIEVEVFRIDSPTQWNFKSIFKGRIIETEIEEEGECSFTFTSKLEVLGREVPRRILQRQCNWDLFGMGCGLDKNKYIREVKLYDVYHDLNGRYIELYVPKPEHYPTAEEIIKYEFPYSEVWNQYWAGGVLNINGERFIVLQDIIKNEELNLHEFVLNRSIKATISEVQEKPMFVVPSCNKHCQICEIKFKNSINHGGFPWIPPDNISEQYSFEEDAGGKK